MSHNDNWNTERKELDSYKVEVEKSAIEDWARLGISPIVELRLVADRLEQIQVSLYTSQYGEKVELKQIATHLRTIAKVLDKQNEDCIELATEVLDFTTSLGLEE